ncbi:MAG: peptidase S41 [Citromicrobium sp.]|nr:MAG: peptidase S41 [Citromicrobium sp.]
MKIRGRALTSIALSLSLIACGGGGGSGGGSAPPIAGTPTPTPTPSSAGCQLSFSQKQDWVRNQIAEWHLYPSLLNLTADKGSYTSLQSYIDALVKPAADAGKDRGFTYITSIAEETAYYNSGSTAGFGVRLAYDTTQNRVFVVEAYETAPALAAGIDRGTEILAVGTTAANLVTIASLMSSGGTQAVVNALGPSDPGVTRVIRFRTAAGVENTVSIAKADFNLDPVSDRYGARIIDDGGKKVGYINLRNFIGPAEPDLRTAFATFRQQGVSEVIVDLRYNGGGLVRIAELFGDLLAASQVGKVFSYTTYNANKPQENRTRLFAAQPEAISATKLAFITTGSSASASELVANAMLPYFGNNMALIGSNSYGKPVGQDAFDYASCDMRLRVMTFKTDNANRQGEYFNGLAAIVPQTCQASDDIRYQLGDPNEASIKAALDFLGGRTCTPMSRPTGAIGAMATPPARKALTPEAGSTAERELPGLY